jgi:CheY-like chemotaxis protein
VIDVLVVDDTPLNLKLLSVLLDTQGYRVRTATTAEEALALLTTYVPRLLLVDIRLPGMDGLALVRELRAAPRLSSLVIVAVTASAMKGDEKAALEAGCDGYVTKPIDTRALPGQLVVWLARSDR